MQDLKNDCIGVKAWTAKTALMLLAMLMWSCSAPDDNVGTVDDLSRDRAIHTKFGCLMLRRVAARCPLSWSVMVAVVNIRIISGW